jgi:hypothetical protein
MVKPMPCDDGSDGVNAEVEAATMKTHKIIFAQGLNNDVI